MSAPGTREALRLSLEALECVTKRCALYGAADVAREKIAVAEEFARAALEPEKRSGLPASEGEEGLRGKAVWRTTKGTEQFVPFEPEHHGYHEPGRWYPEATARELEAALYAEARRERDATAPPPEPEAGGTEESGKARHCNRDGCKDSWHVGGNYGSAVCRNPQHHDVPAVPEGE